MIYTADALSSSCGITTVSRGSGPNLGMAYVALDNRGMSDRRLVCMAAVVAVSPPSRRELRSDHRKKWARKNKLR
jgi:hypothetical protein